MKHTIFIASVFISCCTGHSNQPDKPAAATNKKGNISQTAAPKIISDSTNVLTGKIQQLELEYLAWGCACANWISPAERIKYEAESTLSEHCIFLEPADSTLRLPDFFDPSKHNFIVKGQFYSKEDYPQGTIQTEQILEKAGVFHYTEFTIITKGEKPKIIAQKK